MYKPYDIRYLFYDDYEYYLKLGSRQEQDS